MSKHTKGPWRVDEDGLWVETADGQMKICDMRGWGHLTGKAALALTNEEAIEIQKANADLIAAAPLMAKQLVELRSLLADGEWARQVKAAIDKVLTKAGVA